MEQQIPFDKLRAGSPLRFAPVGMTTPVFDPPTPRTPSAAFTYQRTIEPQRLISRPARAFADSLTC